MHEDAIWKKPNCVTETFAVTENSKTPSFMCKKAT